MANKSGINTCWTMSIADCFRENRPTQAVLHFNGGIARQQQLNTFYRQNKHDTQLIRLHVQFIKRNTFSSKHNSQMQRRITCKQSKTQHQKPHQYFRSICDYRTSYSIPCLSLCATSYFLNNLDNFFISFLKTASCRGKLSDSSAIFIILHE